jgi:hypothetical protein
MLDSGIFSVLLLRFRESLKVKLLLRGLMFENIIKKASVLSDYLFPLWNLSCMYEQTQFGHCSTFMFDACMNRHSLVIAVHLCLMLFD